jgi:hypothetical protein
VRVQKNPARRGWRGAGVAAIPTQSYSASECQAATGDDTSILVMRIGWMFSGAGSIPGGEKCTSVRTAKGQQSRTRSANPCPLLFWTRPRPIYKMRINRLQLRPEVDRMGAGPFAPIARNGRLSRRVTLTGREPQCGSRNVKVMPIFRLRAVRQDMSPTQACVAGPCGSSTFRR